MASPLDSTYGVWLVSLFLETILYGMGILQTWLYFHWYHKDHWGIKAMVIMVTIFETLQITTFFRSTYFCLIENFGNAAALEVINWADVVQLIAGYLSAFTVQMYFAYCVAVFSDIPVNKKSKLGPILICSLAIIQIAAGTAQTIIAADLGLFPLLDETKSKSMTTLQSASTLACDICITFFLFVNLRSHKSSIKSTNSMLNMLMINAVNRGVLTAICAALNMILFLAVPGTFYFFLGLMPSSKLYMNSALATLNSRQHILNTSNAKSHDWRSIPIGRLSTAASETLNSGGRLRGTEPGADTYDMDSTMSGDGKKTFISGMV